MDILGLIAVLSFGLTCFGIGYYKPNKQGIQAFYDIFLNPLHDGVKL